MSMLAQLRELKLALQEDLVTQDEYTEQRRAILTARRPSQAAVPLPPLSDSTAAASISTATDKRSSESDKTVEQPAKKKKTLLDFNFAQIVTSKLGVKRKILAVEVIEAKKQRTLACDACKILRWCRLAIALIVVN